MKTKCMSKEEINTRIKLVCQMSERIKEIGVQIDPHKVMHEVFESRERGKTYVMIVVKDDFGGTRRAYELRDNSMHITAPPHPAKVGI